MTKLEKARLIALKKQDLTHICEIVEGRSHTHFYSLPNGLELEIDGDGECTIGKDLVGEMFKDFSEMEKENDESIADGCEPDWKQEWSVLYLESFYAYMNRGYHFKVANKINEYLNWYASNVMEV